MARIKIELPATFPYHIQIPVRIQDVNYGGHVGNDAILSIMHEARIGYLSSIGFKELDLSEKGISLIMADVAIVYKGEGFHGDIFLVEVTAMEFSTVGFDLYYRITTHRNAQTVTIATAKTGMVCFDYKDRKIMKLPVEMRIKLGDPSTTISTEKL